MRKLHELFHETFLETCRKHFDTPEEKSNYYIEIPFGDALIGMYVDYSVENDKGGRDYDRCVFVKDCNDLINNYWCHLPNISGFIRKEYWLSEFYL